MEELRLGYCPKKTGPYGNGPRFLIICQCCTHMPIMKCARSKACACKKSGRAYTNDCPLNNCSNKGHTFTPSPRSRLRTHTVPRLMNNVNQKIAEGTDAALILYQVACKVVFHPDNPAFTNLVVPDRALWPALPSCAGTSLAAHAVTNPAPPQQHPTRSHWEW